MTASINKIGLYFCIALISAALFSFTAVSNGPTIIIDDTLQSCPALGVSIYPNPSDLGLALHFTEGAYSLSIEATNESQQTVYVETLYVTQYGDFIISTNEWASGYYHFILVGKDCTSTIDIKVL